MKTQVLEPSPHLYKEKPMPDLFPADCSGMTVREFSQGFRRLVEWGAELCADRAAIEREVRERRASLENEPTTPQRTE